MNRIRAVVDLASGTARVDRFGPTDDPRWPGWSSGDDSRWHGLMTSAAASGNGFASRGLYRGLAPDAELVLVRAKDAHGRITSDSIARAQGASRISPGLWVATLPRVAPGRYGYRFVVDGARWIDDPVNRQGVSDGFGGTNSSFEVV